MIPLHHLLKSIKKKNGVKYYFLPSVKWQKAPSLYPGCFARAASTGMTSEGKKNADKPKRLVRIIIKRNNPLHNN